ncbi:hypothetical protein DLAC_11348 [Tieghemostelium lacteum]|uniref:Uncharacterized protein n=1 Tax=Tieghemostelium lacteum TaxID=361077 RepID=A0A151Z3W7_TIELA|nr:hypothetical protein DLAC_11348 [Tieghemostelium lacteum]|eukprot:KYQ88607.1 hypothetical protein DLAC_11348 [Tieghemostelium lacteum]
MKMSKFDNENHYQRVQKSFRPNYQNVFSNHDRDRDDRYNSDRNHRNGFDNIKRSPNEKIVYNRGNFGSLENQYNGDRKYRYNSNGNDNSNRNNSFRHYNQRNGFDNIKSFQMKQGPTKRFEHDDRDHSRLMKSKNYRKDQLNNSMNSLTWSHDKFLKEHGNDYYKNKSNSDLETKETEVMNNEISDNDNNESNSDKGMDDFYEDEYYNSNNDYLSNKRNIKSEEEEKGEDGEIL